MTNSNRKGKNGELDAAARLREILPGVDFRRSVQYNGYSKGAQADLVGLDGLHVEVKRIESGSKTVYKWVEQAERDAADDVAVVLHRSNLNQWLCIVSLDKLVELSCLIVEAKYNESK